MKKNNTGFNIPPVIGAFILGRLIRNKRIVKEKEIADAERLKKLEERIKELYNYLFIYLYPFFSLCTSFIYQFHSIKLSYGVHMHTNIDHHPIRKDFLCIHRLCNQ
jgi:uncharacterized protein YjaG (DUF416 family)